MSTDTTHTFTIAFVILAAGTLQGYLEAFERAGCDDAAFMGPAADGTFLAEFDRDAETFTRALGSAISDLRRAVPDLLPIRVLPDDLVTVSAIAERVGRSRETIRLYKEGRRGPGGFPPAAGNIDNKTQVWRWAEVVRWFADELGLAVPGGEHAQLISALNNALALASAAPGLREHPEEAALVAAYVPDGLRAA